MISNLTFIVDGSIDTFLEKKIVKNENKRIFRGIRLPNNLSVEPGTKFNS